VIESVKRTLKYCAIITLSLLCITEAGAFDVRLSGNRISIKASQVPLQDILEHLVSYGILVRIDPEIKNSRVSISLENADLQKGLDELLGDLSHVLVWETVNSPVGPYHRLAEIQVFRTGKKALIKPLGKDPGLLPVVKHPQDGFLYVKDEILLQLKPGINFEAFKNILRQIGGWIVDMSEWTGVLRIRLPADTDVSSILQKVLQNPWVAKAEPNYAYPIIMPHNDPNSQATSIPNTDESEVGAGAPVAILDTGLWPEAVLEDLILAYRDTLNPEGTISDSKGHGTHMALIASGMVKPQGVKKDPETLIPIIAVRVFDENGFASNFSIMEGLQFAIENGARVVNLSWGSETRSEFMKNALEFAASKGLIILAAAGNEPTGKPVYPAAYPSAIGVGALGPDGERWKKSNYGQFVNFYAPGLATLPGEDSYTSKIFAGTSISTAFIAHSIASYLSQNPEASLAEVFGHLKGAR
jgi:thermitase